MAEDSSSTVTGVDETLSNGGEEHGAEVSPNLNTSADGFPSMTLNIWPPSQRSRDAVIQRLIETLSTPSVLSKRYGVLPPAEASSTARLIEEEAFAAAADGACATSVEEGVILLQKYSKEISRRAIGAVKEKGSTVPPLSNGADNAASVSDESAPPSADADGESS
ncbi:hypothetical protein Cni_G07145 [Canna indica]|uniref:WPP domain-containing protein n=1 Tax=Canna indica TaxID=4628 RepID=A0AAQ3JYA6_9LILI|nr:hypothetical protein Cni_G07145 [Canna indica]